MKDSTYISVLLDRSGSMGSVKDETISGFNHFLKEQRKAGDNCNLSLVQFDTQSIDVVHENLPIKQVPDLNADTYEPRGGTPLLDALGKTIESTGKILGAIPESNRHDKVVFVIITDGQENASHAFSRAKIREMIEHQSSVYKWNFVYLGANQDAFAEASMLGIQRGTTANYATANTAASVGATSSNLATYRQTGNVASLDYSDEQRKKMVGK